MCEFSAIRVRYALLRMLRLRTEQGRGSIPFPRLLRGGLLRALYQRELGVERSILADVYTALVPSNTFVSVRDAPQASLRRFTPCGRFLVTISENLTDVVVFRFESGCRRANWKGAILPALTHTPRSFATPRRSALLTEVDIPLTAGPSESSWFRYDSIERNTCSFGRFFTLQFAVAVANPGETLARDFSLVSSRGRFIIFASYLPTPAPADDDAQPPPEPPPAMRSCPILEKFTLYLVEVETGRVYDRFLLENDYVHLDGHPGVHMYRNLLCILSLRHQTLHILRVQESVGRFVRERKIGPICSDDDEHEVMRHGEAIAPGVGLIPDVETGLGNGKRAEGPFTGLMQRLLTYIFRKYQREGNERKFFQVMAQYSMLVMLKAQLLDDDHLLIQLGSDEGGKAWDISTQTCFYLVYCISSTRILNLFENRSLELLRIFETYQEMFIGDCALAATVRGSSMSDALGAQIRGGNRTEAYKKIRRALSCLPVRAPMCNTSPYMDRKLYSYDMERVDNSRDGKPVTVKFTSVRTGGVRLRLRAGRPALSEHMRLNGASMEDVVMQTHLETLAAASSHTSFLFHPIYPFIMSTVAGTGLTKTMSFHVIGHAEEQVSPCTELPAKNSQGGQWV